MKRKLPLSMQRLAGYGDEMTLQLGIVVAGPVRAAVTVDELKHFD